jgi:hypothetical protein
MYALALSSRSRFRKAFHTSGLVSLTQLVRAAHAANQEADGVWMQAVVLFNSIRC